MKGRGKGIGASAIALFVVVVVLAASLAYYYSATSISPGSGRLGLWSQTTSYPLFPSDVSCVTTSGYIYCVGGYNGTTPLNGQGDMNRTYFTSVSSAGVGPWKRTMDYPIGIQDESCVTSSGYIYCVGGYAGSANGHNIADVYYASLSASGIGQWTKTTTYPYPVEPRCMADSNYVYCAGAHYNGTGYSSDTGDVYAAPVSRSGVGNWTQSTGLPTATAGCASSGGYAYCFGGGSCPPPGPCPSPSYFASLSSHMTSWTRTTDLPTAVWATYTTDGSFLYYFSSPVYFSHISSSGIGPWTTTTGYPAGYPASCVASGGYVYCIGGYDASTNQDADGVYFAHVGY